MTSHGLFRSRASGSDVGDGDAVDTGGSAVGGNVGPRPGKHVAAGDLVVEGVEATLWVLLGTAVEHVLQARDPVGLKDLRLNRVTFV